MSKVSEFAVETLKQYGKENLLPCRSTSDLSPLETWLIVRMFHQKLANDLKNGVVDKKKKE